MNVVAFDLSLTSTGVAAMAGPEETAVDRLPTDSMRGAERLVAIRDWAMRQLSPFAGEGVEVMVVFEDLPHGLRNAAAGALGELHGVIKVAMYERGLVPTLVPPASLKKYATGSGNADKLAMLSAAVQRLGYTGSNSDEVDALWLLHMSLDHAGEPLVRMPATHRAALDKVIWRAPAAMVAEAEGVRR